MFVTVAPRRTRSRWLRGAVAVAVATFTASLATRSGSRLASTACPFVGTPRLGQATSSLALNAAWSEPAPEPLRGPKCAQRRATVLSLVFHGASWTGAGATAVAALEPVDVAPERVWLDMSAIEILSRSEAALADALKNWSRVAADGDSIRRVLGTVGATSPVYALPRAMRSLTAENFDILEQTEAVEFHLRQADFLAYSANFADSSGAACPEAPRVAGRAPPRRRSCAGLYLEDTRAEVQALEDEVRKLKLILLPEPAGGVATAGNGV
ncbi:unnamed protein product [Polarella glacialis]|uniref:Uncharacterized protein n=1 Tax=Polarella glacialis TaxID=89957 RepID=A0A813JFT0_POLGL|nr:unnamed protein product [Polarella glacialis]CAE8718845.1 unnamed protein product [Polarella glacialis]